MDTKERVEHLLKDYHEIKRSLGLLAFKIDNYSTFSIGPNKTIEELTYTSPDGERVTTCSVSDKTARIALNYRNVACNHNAEILLELKRQYESQKYELDLLEYCISLLQKGLSELITDMVIDGMEYMQLGEKYNLSKSSVGRCRKKAVSEITKMFQEVVGGNESQKVG